MSLLVLPNLPLPGYISETALDVTTALELHTALLYSLEVQEPVACRKEYNRDRKK